MPATFIEILRSFNRKERFHLLNQASGGKLEDRNFLSDEFLGELEKQLQIEIPREGDLFWAMDYHLDWIEASLHIHSGSSNVYRPVCGPKETRVTTIEDVDMLIAFPENDRVRLILIEAKYDSAYSNSQWNSKISRLNKLFEDVPQAKEKLIPHFCLMSPSKPSKLVYQTADAPAFAGRYAEDGSYKPSWICLKKETHNSLRSLPKDSNLKEEIEVYRLGN